MQQHRLAESVRDVRPDAGEDRRLRGREAQRVVGAVQSSLDQRSPRVAASSDDTWPAAVASVVNLLTSCAPNSLSRYSAVAASRGSSA
jgi:hypothetical protein